jgi:hypothetical protein
VREIARRARIIFPQPCPQNPCEWRVNLRCKCSRLGTPQSCLQNMSFLNTNQRVYRSGAGGLKRLTDNSASCILHRMVCCCPVPHNLGEWDVHASFVAHQRVERRRILQARLPDFLVSGFFLSGQSGGPCVRGETLGMCLDLRFEARLSGGFDNSPFARGTALRKIGSVLGI